MGKIIKSITVDKELMDIINEEKPEVFTEWATSMIKKGYSNSKNPQTPRVQGKIIGVSLE